MNSIRIKTLIVAALAALSLLLALPVLADAPAGGVVVEGESVPGVALGATRAQVETTYGEPIWCQSTETAGDLGYCGFAVDGGGLVSIRYRGADGGGPAAAPDDVAAHIRWSEAVSGWKTTAGVDTALAGSDPHAVVAAYPDASVVYYESGHPFHLTAHEKGFGVRWDPDFYRGDVHVSMSIFGPRPAPPPPPPVEQITYVSDIGLTAGKEKGKRTVIALVHVRDQTHLAAEGATVYGTWTFPSGISQEAAMPAVTSSSGYAYFEVTSRDRGTYTFSVHDVVLEGHRFAREQSALSESIRAK